MKKSSVSCINAPISSPVGAFPSPSKNEISSSAEKDKFLDSAMVAPTKFPLRVVDAGILVSVWIEGVLLFLKLPVGVDIVAVGAVVASGAVVRLLAGAEVAFMFGVPTVLPPGSGAGVITFGDGVVVLPAVGA